MAYRNPPEPHILRKIMAIVWYNPVGRLFIYALGLLCIAFGVWVATGNDFDTFYLVFGFVLLLLVVVNWIHYAIELARRGGEDDPAPKNMK